jgi:hypothetical protein
MVKSNDKPNPTADVHLAEGVIAELQEKQRAAQARSTALLDERKSISLAAHTGDQKAHTRLDRINFQIFSVDGELQSLAAALAEAGARLTAARQAEADAADHEAAKALLAQLTHFRDFAGGVDSAIEVLVASTNGLQETLTEINRCGSAFPSQSQLLSLGGRVLLGAMSRTPFKRNFETLPPLERSRSMAGIVEQWCTTIERQIAERLGEQTTNNEAA